jgi:hypothetical protein
VCVCVNLAGPRGGVSVAIVSPSRLLSLSNPPWSRSKDALLFFFFFLFLLLHLFLASFVSLAQALGYASRAAPVTRPPSLSFVFFFPRSVPFPRGRALRGIPMSRSFVAFPSGGRMSCLALDCWGGLCARALRPVVRHRPRKKKKAPPPKKKKASAAACKNKEKGETIVGDAV